MPYVIPWKEPPKGVEEEKDNFAWHLFWFSYKKFLGIQNPFYKKGFGRRRQKLTVDFGHLNLLK